MLLPFCVPNPSLSPCSLAIVVLYYFLSFTAAASLPRSLDPYGNDFRKYTQTISESTGEVTRTSSPGGELRSRGKYRRGHQTKGL